MPTLLASGLAWGEGGVCASISLFHMTLFSLCFSPSLGPIPTPFITTRASSALQYPAGFSPKIFRSLN